MNRRSLKNVFSSASSSFTSSLSVLARCSIYNLIFEPNAPVAHNRIYAKLRNQNAKITKLSPKVDSNLTKMVKMEIKRLKTKAIMSDVSVLRINGIINSPHRASKSNKIQYSRIFIRVTVVASGDAPRWNHLSYYPLRTNIYSTRFSDGRAVDCPPPSPGPYQVPKYYSYTANSKHKQAK